MMEDSYEYGTALFDGEKVYEFMGDDNLDTATELAASWNRDNALYANEKYRAVTCIVVRRTAPVKAGPWEPAIYNATDVKEALYGAGKMGAL